MTQETNPYECCGQVRDSNFCPMCGCAIHRRCFDPMNTPITKTSENEATFLLTAAGSEVWAQANLRWWVGEGEAVLDLVGPHVRNMEPLTERSLRIMLKEDGRLVLYVCRRGDGEHDAHVGNTILEHQLWPVEPAAPPKDKPT